jgi:hypothetical protein
MNVNTNVITYSYLFLRLAPFIVVSFFTILSIFNQDFKGIIYLVGLIFSSFVSMLIYNSLSLFIPNEVQANVLCNLMSLSEDQTTSAIPIGQNILGYSFAYLMYFIIADNVVQTNVPIITLFPIFIAFDGIWNFKYNCFNPFQLILSLGLGVAFGVMWGAIIYSTGVSDLQYFGNKTNTPNCSRPTKSTFRCTVFKNGQALASTTTN